VTTSVVLRRDQQQYNDSNRDDIMPTRQTMATPVTATSTPSGGQSANQPKPTPE